ncbi:hypothetical protein Y032_0558g3434 [Ancylostoma ceylanicum]|nr:hypothetical protein Y032_0558g3434 [Ancylostoma ceylanicum]
MLVLCLISAMAAESDDMSLDVSPDEDSDAIMSGNEGTAVPAEINLRQKRAGGMWWRHDMDKYKTKQPKNA